MDKTNLEELLKIPQDDRDEVWEEHFFSAFSSASIKVTQSEPVNGPDSWPYLLAETGAEAEEPSQKVLEWLSSRGIGLVLNPQKPFPDYVFSYGMIWSFRETGLFIRRLEADEQGSEVEFHEGQKILAGPPTTEFLPVYVREILKEFFGQQSVSDPRVLVMSTDGENFDLAFSLDALGNPPENEHEGILEAISWFLPPHYSLILVPEQGLPEFHLL